MNPLHPKLRQALLQDKTHRRNGLTPSRLLEYEQLGGQLYYTIHYPERPLKTEDLEILVLDEEVLGNICNNQVKSGINLCSVLEDIYYDHQAEFNEPHTADGLIESLKEKTDDPEAKKIIENGRETILANVKRKLRQYRVTPAVTRRLAEEGVDCQVIKILEKIYPPIIDAAVKDPKSDKSKSANIKKEDRQSKTFYSADEFDAALREYFGADNPVLDAYYECNKERIFDAATVVIPTGPLVFGLSETDLRQKIADFRSRFMPRYPQIHADWVKQQQRIIDRSQFDLTWKNFFFFIHLGRSLDFAGKLIYRKTFFPIFDKIGDWWGALSVKR